MRLFDRLIPKLSVPILLLLTACGGSSDDAVVVWPRDGFDIGSGFSYTVWDIAPAADGNGDFYVGGQFTVFANYIVDGIVRLNADGTLDAGFDMGAGFDGTVLAIVPATDGSGDIYVGGVFTQYNGTAANHIIRLNADGSVDAGFNTGTGFNDLVYTIAEAGDGSGDIYVGGDFSSYNGTGSVRLARLNSDGSFDAAFNVGAGASDTVKTLSVVPGGGGDSIYVGGDFTFFDASPANHVLRLQDDGSVDAGFVVGTGFDDIVEVLVPAADGSGDLYAGGDFLSYNGNPSIRAARLNSDGSFDSAFATSIGFDSTVYDIAIDSGNPGQVYFAGTFTTFDGNAHRRIACLNNAGFVCAGFSSGEGFSSGAVALAFANDTTGDLFVGGGFYYYRNAPVYRLVRLDSSGTSL